MAYYKDAVHRNRLCEEYLRDNDIKIVRRFMVWCQGCTDGDLHTDSKVYEKFTENMLHSFMKKCNIETCFLIQIGNKRSEPELYLPIQKAQQNIAEKHKDIVIVSRSFEKLKEFMKDEFHYHQEGYNIVGEEAGKNAGNYVIRTATGL